MEAQRAKSGKVRAVILKGRQEGCSTYIQGRAYWRVTHQRGMRAYILTHEEEATSNLFEMARRFHEHCPSLVRPITRTDSAKELTFDGLDSSYKVGTAGNRAAGRSQTVQIFHGSEVGYWPHAQEHAAGVLQAIPDMPGTEVYLESTAGGIGNYYHEQWQAAERGETPYQAIFIPWYWQAEYRAQETGIVLDEAEREYAQAYGLDDEQMAWRRAKLAELKAPALFAQEYPATAAEAFQQAGLDPYIQASIVLRARKSLADPYGAKVLGVDPARFGDDRTALAARQGRLVLPIESHVKKDTMEVVAIVHRKIKEWNPARVFVDVGGLGAGVYDRLRELVPHALLVAVNSGERPMDALRYGNKRAEMWGEMREWLAAEPQVQIPDDDELQADLCGVKYRYDSNQRLFLERKEDMKKRGLRSPDKGDALALTFASPVSPDRVRPAEEEPYTPAGAGWMS